jgi:hypothetical protein
LFIRGVVMQTLLHLPLFTPAHFFREIQARCFYPNSLSRCFLGNAAPLLLPKFTSTRTFGQCSASPFTQIHFRTHFRAMQRFSFYPNSLSRWFSGNAAPLLLPFFTLTRFLGQCSTSAFTLFLFQAHFGAMQRLSFYPNSLPRCFSGNATHLLLPKFTFTLFFGQCSASPFTLFLFQVQYRQCSTSKKKQKDKPFKKTCLDIA